MKTRSDEHEREQAYPRAELRRIAPAAERVRQPLAPRDGRRADRAVLPQWGQDPEQDPRQLEPVVERELPGAVEQAQALGKRQANEVCRVVVLMPAFPREDIHVVEPRIASDDLARRVVGRFQVPVQLSIGYVLHLADEVHVLGADTHSPQHRQALLVPALRRHTGKCAARQIEADGHSAAEGQLLDHREHAVLIVLVRIHEQRTRHGRVGDRSGTRHRSDMVVDAIASGQGANPPKPAHADSW